MKISSKTLSFLLYVFYAIVIVFIIGTVYSSLKDKDSFFISNDNVDMIVASDYQIHLIGSKGTPDYSKYEFISENENIATVDSNGIVKAISEGQTNIIVKSKKYDFEDKIAVNIDGNSIYSISFYIDEVNMDIDETYKPTVLINDSSKMNVSAVWESSNSKIATVNNGTIKAISPGVTYIVATIKDTKYSSRLKVIVNSKQDNSQSTIDEKEDIDDSYEAPDENVNDYIPVSSVEITSNIDYLKVSDEKDIEYRILPETATNKNVKWSSNNPNVVSVNNNGHINALSEGTADIIVNTEDGNKKVFITINVNNNWTPVKSIKLNKSSLSLYEGKTYNLNVDISPETATDKALTWPSSNTSIATVDSDGMITAKKAGKTKITVKTSNNVSTVCDVTVKKNTISVQSISLNKTNTTLVEGGSEKLIVTFVPSNATNKNVTWTSSDKSVATVDSKGKVTAKKAGTTVITAKTSNNKKASCTINVNSKLVDVNSVYLNRSNVSIEVGQSFNLIATINPKNATNQNISFESSDSSIAIVEETGKVIAIKEGTAIITVRTANGKEAKCTINVTKKSIYATEVKLNKSSISIIVGGTYSLTATIVPSNATNNNVTWTSSNKSVATVDSNGKVTAKKEGTATVYAKTSNNKIATCEVKVTTVKIESITFNTSNTILEKGKTKTVKVSIKPNNASYTSIKYSSSNNSVATIDQNGKITAVSYGEVAIKASAQDGSGKSASFKLIVSPAGSMIDIRNVAYKVYSSSVGNQSKHIQNFAISNINAAKPTIYLSTVEVGNAKSSNNKLTNSIVYKYTRNSKTSYSSGGTMYLKKSGHGQSFDVEPNSNVLWINAYGEPYESGGKWWGGNNGVQRIKFKKNKNGDAISPISSFKFLSADNKPYKKLQPSIDESNDLIMMGTNKFALIYKYSDLKANKKTLIYTVNLSSKISNKYGDGTTVYNQGLALRNGYIYQFRGAPGKTGFIEVFNLMGVSKYVVKLNDSKYHKSYYNKTKVEPEGIRIYNNRVYIGSTHKESDGSRFDIGYF